MKLQNPFRRRSPEEKRRRQLLRQWRRPHPFNLWLWLLRRRNRCRSLAAIAAAARNERTASLRAARRRLRQTRKKTGSAWLKNALNKKLRHCRRHCRVALHQVKTRLLRWLLLLALCWTLRLVLCLLPVLLPCLFPGRKRS